MQESQPGRGLLTALEVQDLLQVDRSTVYRMAEDGRLPAIRVGRSWRFPTDRIAALLTSAQAPAGPVGQPAPLLGAPAPDLDSAPTTPPRDRTTGSDPAPGLNIPASSAAVEVAADLLGVMMVVTDMQGHPVTEVTNPCAWFQEHAADPGVLDRCVAEWRDLADNPDLAPRFQVGALGFQCARAFIRDGSTLVGMVLAGGVSPATDPAGDPDLHHLDDAARAQVLAALPRIAAAIAAAPAPPAPRAPDTPAPQPAAAPAPAPGGATPKENR